MLLDESESPYDRRSEVLVHQGSDNFEPLDLTMGLLPFCHSSVVDMVGAVRYDGENGLVNVGR